MFLFRYGIDLDVTHDEGPEFRPLGGRSFKACRHELPRSMRLIEVQNIDVVGGVFHFEVSIANAPPLVDNIGDIDVSSIEVHARWRGRAPRPEYALLVSLHSMWCLPTGRTIVACGPLSPTASENRTSCPTSRLSNLPSATLLR